MFQQGDHGEDQNGLEEDEEGEVAGDAREEDRGDAGGGGDEVEAEDGGAARHAAGDEAVAEVIGVADEGTFAAHHADEAYDD